MRTGEGSLGLPRTSPGESHLGHREPQDQSLGPLHDTLRAEVAPAPHVLPQPSGPPPMLQGDFSVNPKSGVGWALVLTPALPLTGCAGKVRARPR